MRTATEYLDLFGNWKLWDRGGSWPGRLVFFTEWRHKFTDVAASRLVREIGSLWGTTSAFSEQDVSVVQLYWDQGSFEDGFRYRLGKIDPGALYDAGRYVSSSYAFLSLAFSDTLAMPLPGSGLGAVAAVYPFGQTYVMAGVHDASGAKTTTRVHTLSRGELFASPEIGATPGFGPVSDGF